ncbi:hypothetical protein [Sporosarcina sp. P17b]|uniref:hypothetical protein n=1 Tax=Sporosarcina sp. P17b TaxID=2048260 RepID=UPI000C17060B|nr:hypothetical protein [Sporosarcina sp. P17b]PIC73323.1 hypothetical protein CSV76_10930 [Sporosarcina sp. P17b]
MKNKIREVLPESQLHNRLKTRVSIGTTISTDVLASTKEYAKAEGMTLTNIFDIALTEFLAARGITVPNKPE